MFMKILLYHFLVADCVVASKVRLFFQQFNVK
jgi:hypothetical protein